MDSTIPAAVSLGILALAVVQIAVQITALVQLVRTPSERVTIGGRKWVWALIIVFGEILGAIIWFIVGRKPATVDTVAPSAAPETRAAAADALYGGTAGAAQAPAPPTSDAPAVVPPPTPPNPAIFDDVAATPEGRAGDPEIGADGTGAGELP